MKILNIQRSLLAALISALAFFFLSCEEVIQLDLDSAAPRTVIEGVVDAGSGVCSVHLTTTADYYSTLPINTIPGAVITLSFNNGTTQSLTDSGNGGYGLTGLSLKHGDKVSITIVTPDNVSYNASVITPLKTILDSIFAEPLKGGPGPGGGQKDQYQVVVLWRDSAFVNNFYRLKITVNDTVNADQYSLLNDELLDGKVFRQPVSGGRVNRLDSVIVELLSVDKAYYEYFRQYARGRGPNSGSTTPYNPRGNFDQEVLGYFGVVYRSQKKIVVQ